MLILAMAKARRYVQDLIRSRVHLRASRRRPVRSIPMNRHQRQGDEIMSRDIARKSGPSSAAMRRWMLPSRSAVVVALAFSASAHGAKAEDFPERPVQMIVSVGAGGSTDTMMRALVQYAAPLLGQPIVIMNRPGASGMIGVAQVKQAKPDGYTIGGTWSGPLTMAPHVNRPDYKPGDYTIVAMVSEAPGVLCVSKDFPANSGRELLDELRRNPDKYTYGADGIGGFVQFATERVFAAAHVKARMIPFSGADQTVTAFLSGTINIYGGAITSVLPYVQQGTAKCLLVTSALRYPVLPNVDGLSDVGLADTQTLLWRAVIAPAGVPADRLAKLKEVFSKAAQDPEFRKIALARGEQPWTVDTGNIETYVRDEYATMGTLADALKLTVPN
jgi:tripartite-type tricarboxylate transporter receptor subunit TctC